MLNLKQLMARTFPNRKDAADYVALSDMKTGYWKGGPDKGKAYIAAHTRSTNKKEPSTYVTAITFMDAKLNVHVSCSCADSTFRFEFANWSRDAADIEYSNGEPPLITNPSMRPGMCKHLVALARVAMTKIKPRK